MPAKLVDGQPVGPAPARKRAPKPQPTEPATPREATLESVADELGELRASIEVMSEDLGAMADTVKTAALVRDGNSKDVTDALAKSATATNELRADMRRLVAVLGAELGALAVADSVSVQRHARFLREVQKLGAKYLTDEAAQETKPAATKPMPSWLFGTFATVAVVIVCLAMFGAYCIVR